MHQNGEKAFTKSSLNIHLKIPLLGGIQQLLVKFIYSEKATKFCEIEISTVDLSYVVPVKSVVEILQNFVAFSEYMDFR